MNPYEVNETMRLIGHQNSETMGGIHEAFSLLNNIAKARPQSGTNEFALDCYIIGYINGKRAERSRKLNKA